jgi:photosystem II stability/assembly factor-like uncharacterized protein
VRVSRNEELATMLIPENTAFQNSFGSLAVVTYQPGETVIVDGSKTGRLLILKEGTVTIEKEGRRPQAAADFQSVMFAPER